MEIPRSPPLARSVGGFLGSQRGGVPPKLRKGKWERGKDTETTRRKKNILEEGGRYGDSGKRLLEEGDHQKEEKLGTAIGTCHNGGKPNLVEQRRKTGKFEGQKTYDRRVTSLWKRWG